MFDYQLKHPCGNAFFQIKNHVKAYSPCLTQRNWFMPLSPQGLITVMLSSLGSQARTFKSYNIFKTALLRSWWGWVNSYSSPSSWKHCTGSLWNTQDCPHGLPPHSPLRVRNCPSSSNYLWTRPPPTPSAPARPTSLRSAEQNCTVWMIAHSTRPLPGFGLPYPIDLESPRQWTL